MQKKVLIVLSFFIHVLQVCAVPLPRWFGIGLYQGERRKSEMSWCI
jgi:hypothetical protein